MSNCSGPDCLVPDPSEHGYNFDTGLGISIFVVTILIILLFSLLYCARVRQQSFINNLSFRWRDRHFASENSAPIRRVLDEVTIQSFPRLLYSEVGAENEDREEGQEESSRCSVCLADYEDTDVLRVMPKCGHRFHLQCGDRWLRMNPTCPICRQLQVPKARLTLPPLTSREVIRPYVVVVQHD